MADSSDTDWDLAKIKKRKAKSNRKLRPKKKRPVVQVSQPVQEVAIPVEDKTETATEHSATPDLTLIESDSAIDVSENYYVGELFKPFKIPEPKDVHLIPVSPPRPPTPEHCIALFKNKGSNLYRKDFITINKHYEKLDQIKFYKQHPEGLPETPGVVNNLFPKKHFSYINIPGLTATEFDTTINSIVNVLKYRYDEHEAAKEYGFSQSLDLSINYADTFMKLDLSQDFNDMIMIATTISGQICRVNGLFKSRADREFDELMAKFRREELEKLKAEKSSDNSVKPLTSEVLPSTSIITPGSTTEHIKTPSLTSLPWKEKALAINQEVNGVNLNGIMEDAKEKYGYHTITIDTEIPNVKSLRMVPVKLVINIRSTSSFNPSMKTTTSGEPMPELKPKGRRRSRSVSKSIERNFGMKRIEKKTFMELEHRINCNPKKFRINGVCPACDDELSIAGVAFTSCGHTQQLVSVLKNALENLKSDDSE